MQDFYVFIYLWLSVFCVLLVDIKAKYENSFSIFFAYWIWEWEQRTQISIARSILRSKIRTDITI